MKKSIKMFYYIFIFFIIGCTSMNMDNTNEITQISKYNFFQSDSPIDVTGINTTFYGNVSYGQENKQVFDIWVPDDSIEPTALVIDIHGGGFISGNKEDTYSSNGEQNFIRNMLNEKIAYMTINYSLLNTEVEECGVLCSLKSGERALKFIKYHADFFNIDKTKIHLKGNSAGAGIAMWLGYGSDLSIPDAVDEVERESTDVLSISLINPQASYDLMTWETEVFVSYGYDLELDYDTNSGSRNELHRFYAIEEFNDLFLTDIITYRANVDMIQMIDDNGGIPTWVTCTNTPEGSLNSNHTLNDINHNSYHGEVTRTHLLAEGTEVVSNITGLSGDNTNGENEKQFIIRKLTL